MSFTKIALFAFGLATIITAGAVDANATSYAGRSYSYGTWSNGAYVSPGQALFDRAKGNPQGY